MDKSNVLVIILAGGLSTRFGPIGQVIPKCVFPVAGTCLLKERINNLMEAGFENILVSCRPEHHKVIKKLSNENKYNKITFLKNNDHKKGPVTALVNINCKKFPLVLVVLADIFSLGNEFEKICLEKLNGNEVILLASIAQKSDFEKGGLIIQDGRGNYTIKESLTKPNKNSFRWTGTILLNKKALDTIKRNVNKIESRKIGDYYNNLILDNFRFKIVKTSPFINVNNSEDFLNVMTLLNNSKK